MRNTNPLNARHDYARFKYVLLADSITVSGNEMSVHKSGFANAWFQIRQISYFRPLEVGGRGSETQLQVGGYLSRIP